MSGVSLPAIGRAGPAVSAGLRRGVAALGTLRWLVPTALFEGCRDFEPHYMAAEELHDALTQAGFEILDAKRTFLGEISCLAWVRRVECAAEIDRWRVQ